MFHPCIYSTKTSNLEYASLILHINHLDLQTEDISPHEDVPLKLRTLANISCHLGGLYDGMSLDWRKKTRQVGSSCIYTQHRLPTGCPEGIISLVWVAYIGFHKFTFLTHNYLNGFVHCQLNIFVYFRLKPECKQHKLNNLAKMRMCRLSVFFPIYLR